MPSKQGKGKIDYLDYTTSPVKGLCPNTDKCYYCYMKSFYQRFNIDPALREDQKELRWSPRQPSKIGVCFNLDLFHPAISNTNEGNVWIDAIIDHCEINPQHTYLFLTKKPTAYSGFHWSPPILHKSNIWLGTTWDGLLLTQTNVMDMATFGGNIAGRYVSFEPLLADPYHEDLSNIDWIIIGADSNRGAPKPQKRWIDTLVGMARELHIPIWMKDNLPYPKLIKESPL